MKRLAPQILVSLAATWLGLAATPGISAAPAQPDLIGDIAGPAVAAPRMGIIGVRWVEEPTNFPFVQRRVM